MTQATQTRTLVMERELKHSQDKVWRAMTDPALLEQWMMKNDFQPVAGHQFTFRGEPRGEWDGIVPCEVLAVEPKSRLSFRWYAWNVDLTLTPTAEGVSLRMEQGPFPVDDNAAYGGAQYGWTGFLGALEKLLPQI